ncbi:MAG: hypothetical protein AAF985_14440 [Bacteroidota bacterium]
MRKYSTPLLFNPPALLYGLTLFLAVLGGCQHESTESPVQQIAPKAQEPPVNTVDLLFFKAEQKLEIWQNETALPPRQLSTLPLSSSQSLPIGIFEVISDSSTLKLLLPGAFYQEKLAQFSIEKAQWNLDQAAINITSLLQPEERSLLLKQLSGATVNRALVFPNEARKGRELQACFACPHWMTENYAKLKIELQRYPS